MSDPYLTYPFEVRDGVIAELRLPIGLTRTEAERVAAFVMTLALKGDESEPQAALPPLKSDPELLR